VLVQGLQPEPKHFGSIEDGNQQKKSLISTTEYACHIDTLSNRI